MLAMEEGAGGFQKIATTDHTQQLPPGIATRMAIGAEIAPSRPSPIGTVRVRAEMGGGVELASAPPRGHEARRDTGCLRGEVAGMPTGVAARVGRQARKWGSLTV